MNLNVVHSSVFMRKTVLQLYIMFYWIPSTVFNFQALSKQHACIEIKGESHLIYDKGSRNKTRKERVNISHYVLKNKDE